MTYEYAELEAWNERVRPLVGTHVLNLDFHRLQLERWLWDARFRMQPPIVEIGCEFRHWYMKDCLTVNNKTYSMPTGLVVKPDILGDIMHLPLASESIGTLICTEVLEHVPYIFHAAVEIHRVLKSGGTAFMSAPFMWPTHDNDNYADYWRITEQGWRFMFGKMDALIVTPTVMGRPGRTHWNQIALWEKFGEGWECDAPTGYLVEARK